VRFAESGHAHELVSEWTPGQPVWHGTVDGEEKAVQVRPILNGYVLAHRGVSIDARVYTRREAELAALMPEKKQADTSKALLCPMPGLVKAVYVTVGQEVKAGETLCGGRGDEDGERAARRARRHGQEDQRERGRLARRRRGDHGIQLTTALSRRAKRQNAAGARPAAFFFAVSRLSGRSDICSRPRSCSCGCGNRR
jgi:hypothetical protein